MKFTAIMLFLFAALSLNGCGGSGDGASLDSTLPKTNPPNSPPSGGIPGTAAPGILGELHDLGDLVEPDGDRWYFTRAVAINSQGAIVGQSNAGNPVRAAFLLTPEAGMSYLGIHPGYWDDYYRLNQKLPNRAFMHSEAVDLNDYGMVIGNSSTGKQDEKRAFAWIQGEWIDLAPPPYRNDDGKYEIGGFSEAIDVNNQGEVVLTAQTRFGKGAFYWDGSSTRTVQLEVESKEKDAEPIVFDVEVPVLVSLGGIVDKDAAAVAINENRQAVSNSGGTAVFTDLRLLSNGLIITEPLNHLPGASETKAVAMNDSLPTAHVVGNSGDRGFFWDGGAMYPIQDFGGGTSEATDINNLDQVVGSATLPDGSFHAFLWTLGEDRKGHIRDLGTLGGKNSHAVAINELGQVIGWSETGELYEQQGVVVPVRHAFLWQDGIMYDLGTHDHFYGYPFTPPFPFSEAAAINDKGQVAGNSLTINAHSRGFRLTPVFP
jgi:probable HAF family extracellular repeat protein